MCVLLLGNVEENDTVSRALSRLSEVQEKVESLHAEQVPSPLSLSLSQGVNTHLLSTTRARSLRHTGLPMYMYLVTKRVLVFEL